MSETTRNILLFSVFGFGMMVYIWIFINGVYIMDPDRIKRRKKALKAKRKLTARAS
jgi:hypothetical protein